LTPAAAARAATLRRRAVPAQVTDSGGRWVEAEEKARRLVELEVQGLLRRRQTQGLKTTQHPR